MCINSLDKEVETANLLSINLLAIIMTIFVPAPLAKNI